MSRQLPEIGTYQARRAAAIIVREEESGALMAYIPCALIGVAFSFTHALCLGAKDGTVQKKNIANLIKAFPEWDGTNPFELENIPLREDEAAEFELAECYHDDTYIPEGETEPVIQFKAQWFNALGGGISKEPMDEAEQKKVLTRWGGKFKANVGKSSPSGASRPAPAAAGKTTAPAKTAPAAKPGVPARAAAPAPPSRRAAGGQARTSTQEEVWMALSKENEKSDSPLENEDLIKKFYAAQDEVRADANGEMTPAEWGKVAEALGV